MQFDVYTTSEILVRLDDYINEVESCQMKRQKIGKDKIIKPKGKMSIFVSL